MGDARLDVLAIGDAVVDVIATADDAFLAEEGLVKGSMHELDADALDAGQIRDAAILYLEAYLWRSAGPRAAMEQAMAIAHEAGRKVAFTLSDIACIKPHRREMMAMLEAGAVDLLFANENEVRELADTPDRDAAIAALRDKVPLIVVTCEIG